MSRWEQIMRVHAATTALAAAQRCSMNGLTNGIRRGSVNRCQAASYSVMAQLTAVP
jgi:hypothetical protein